MNVDEVLQRCRELAKDDPALDQDIRALIVFGVDSDRKVSSEQTLRNDIDALEDSLSVVEEENRELRKQLNVLKRELEITQQKAI